MNYKKIFIVGRFSIPDGSAAAQLIINLGKLFRNLGYDITFIDFQWSNDSQNFIEEQAFCGFKVLKLSYKKSLRGYIQYLISKKPVIDLWDNNSIVCCYNFPSISMFRIFSDCKKRNNIFLPIITEWYSFDFKDKLCVPRYIDTFIRMNWVIKKSDGIIVCSKFLSDYYKNYCKILKIPTLIDMSDKKWNIEGYKYTKGVNNLVIAGTIGKTKERIDKFIKIACKLPPKYNFCLRIVGIEKSQFIKIYPKIKKILDDEKIEFLGKKTHSECLKIINGSDYSVIYRDVTRTTMAGFPTKFAESLACGTPVITTDTSDIKNFICEEQNGYILSFDDQTAMIQLESIFSNTAEEKEKMKDYAHNYKEFDFHMYERATEEFLDEIILGKYKN